MYLFPEDNRDDGATYPLIADVAIEFDGKLIVPATVKLLNDKFVPVVTVRSIDD